MADEPLERLRGKTPLAAAHTPMLDALARKSEIGTVQTVPNGVRLAVIQPICLFWAIRRNAIIQGEPRWKRWDWACI